MGLFEPFGKNGNSRHNQQPSRESVSAEAIEQLAGWDSVKNSLGEIRAAHNEFEGFFSETFDQLGGLFGQLVEQAGQWQHQRSQSEDELQLSQLLEEVRQQRVESRSTQQEVHEQVTRLATIAATLAETRTDSGSNGDEHLNELLEEVRQQRSQLEGVQETAKTQAENLITLATELAETRSGLSRSTESRAGSEQLDEQIRRMQQQQAEWEQERRLLETELESVRNRAAEMSDAVAEQKRTAAGQQKQWAEELKRMRRALEGMSARVPGEDRPPARSPTPPAEPQRKEPVAEQPSEPDGDPVLDSVMAQFEMLQRDLAKRRAAKT